MPPNQNRMEKDTASYRILIVEDSMDDFAYISDLLSKRIAHPTISHANDIKTAKELLKEEQFDIILLDLHLPDGNGQQIVDEIKKSVNLCEVIIFSDATDMNFTLDLIAQGVSDYLFKSELTSWLLYKSIIYAMERKKTTRKLKVLKKRYSDLFNLNPLPMWVYRVDTLQFVRVNKAAIQKYGYSKEEFEQMTLRDIRPEEDIPKLEEAIEFVKNHELLFSSGLYRHKKKNGDIIFVELVSNIIYVNDEKFELVLANDITDRVNYINAIEEQNSKLQEIAFTQSHIVRAPLANMMGILHLVKDMDLNSAEGAELLEHFFNCGVELDKSIREIVSKSSCYVIPKIFRP